MAEPLGGFRRFLSELKRRNVYRVGVTYVVVAFLTLQAAELLFPATTLEGLYDELVLLAFVGFPIALVLAWAFEVTPEGVRRTPPDRPEGGGRRWSTLQTLLVAGLAASAAAGGWYLARGEGAEEPGAEAAAAGADTAGARAPAVPERSIAVLPFENLSEAESNEYFSDGVTEDVLTALAKIGELRVISRTSSMTYEDTDKTVREIGRELGVATVLEGSVRRYGDRIRISAQLIDARDDRHLWAETYDRQAGDLFAVQSEIARAIADALEAELTEDERDRILAGGTESLDAYELYLRGRERLRDATDAEGNEEAIAYFQRALGADPDYALAHAGLSRAYSARQQYRGVAWGDSAILSAARAISRDPQAAESYVAMANAQSWWGLFDRARDNLRRALELNPNDADAVEEMSAVQWSTGHKDEALRYAVRAVSLDPTYVEHYLDVAISLLDLGAEEGALEWLERARAMDPDHPWIHWTLADLHLRRGDLERAERTLDTLRTLSPGDPGTLRTAAEVEMRREDWDAALDLMERWHETRSEEWQPRDVLGWLQAKVGEEEAARASLRQAEEMARLWLGRGDQGAWPHGTLSVVQLARGDTDRAMASVERAVDRGQFELVYLLERSPVYAPLRDHPRYRPLVDDARRRLRRMREAVGADTIRPPGSPGER